MRTEPAKSRRLCSCLCSLSGHQAAMTLFTIEERLKIVIRQARTIESCARAGATSPLRAKETAKLSLKSLIRIPVRARASTVTAISGLAGVAPIFINGDRPTAGEHHDRLSAVVRAAGVGHQ